MVRWRTLAALVGAALSGWAGGAATLDLYGGSAPADGPWDAIVVAGAGVMPGGAPSHALTARTRLAVDLYERGVAPRLALTGGVGDWPPSEAEVARRLAEGWGVPPSAIVAEDRSTSTEGNARELAGVLGPARVLVVTDRYHVLRCERVFGRYFREVDGVGATSPAWVRTRGAFREVLAVGLYAATGRL